MRRHIVYALGLALALSCAGAWAFESQGAGNSAGAGTALQTPAPANPNAPAAPDQTAPNAAQPNPAQPNAPPPNPAAPNPAPPDQAQPNPAPPNPAPPDQTQPNPAQPNPAPPNPPAVNPAPPSQQPATAAPVYSSPLQEFASHQVDEIGELSQEVPQFQAAKRPDAVMVLYHMIRDHRLLADAAQNVLARRGDVATPTITPMPVANTPEDTLRQDIQGREQAAANLQQMIANASPPAEKRIYQRALDVTNKHLTWLHSLDQGQQVAVGFFGPTTPLGDLTGTAVASAAAAPGYPQPVVARTAGFQQQFESPRPIRHSRTRRFRHRRYSRYSRTYRTRQSYSYR